MFNKVLDYARVMQTKQENSLVKNKMRYYVFDKKSENQLLKKGSIAFIRIANREKQRKSGMYIDKLHYFSCIYFILFKLTCISQDSFVAKTIPSFLGIFAST